MNIVQPNVVGGSTIVSPTGNQGVLAGEFDFNSLIAPNVNFQEQFNFAQAQGQQNLENFYNNITSPRSSAAALGLVGTDVQGILQGVNSLAPFAREQGNIDTNTNINRAGTIDQSNLSRIPGFNSFNQQQATSANNFNQQQQNEAIDATGIGFRNRTNNLLGILDQQVDGRLNDGFLDTLATTSSQNRGAELAGASGVGAGSRSATDIRDSVNFQTRLGLRNQAIPQLANLNQVSQQALQAPIERPPTLFGQPTQVPLNPSNTENRVPITSSVSAGQAQLSIGSEATNQQNIPAVTALSAGLSTAQFNAQSAFARDVKVADETQNQLTSRASALQGVINADRGDAIREQDYEVYREGLAARAESERIAATTALAGGGGGVIAGGGGGGISGGGGASGGGSGLVAQQGGGATGALPGTFGQIAQGVEGVQAILGATGIAEGIGNRIAGAFDSDGSGAIEIGGFSVTGEDISRFLGGSRAEAESPGSARAPQVTSIPRGQDIPEGYEAIGGSTDGSIRIRQTGSSDNSPFRAFTQPLEDATLDSKDVQRAGNLISRWGDASNAERFNLVTGLVSDSLANRGVIDQRQAGHINRVGSALTGLSNPNLSDSQRALLVGSTLHSVGMDQFTGSIDTPTTINGQRVLPQSVVTQDGKPGFQLENGNVIGKESLQTSNDTANALRAFAVLTSDASDENKAIALGGVGLSSAASRGVIDQVNAGNISAGLQVLSLANNFDEMDDFQRAVSTIQTGSAAFNAVTGNLANTAGTEAIKQFSAGTASSFAGGGTGAGTSSATAGAGAGIGSALGATAGVAGIALGVHTAADVFSATEDMARSQAGKPAVTGGVASGIAIGAGAATLAASLGATTTAFAALGSAALPVVGTLIGAAVGAAVGGIAASTGSGKGAGQKMRDQWRSGLEAVGITQVEDGAHNVTLADGSKYDIGLDGGHKLQNVGTNVDGNSERNTFDVDWSNPLQSENIPMAHIFAIATGNDPSQEMDLFHRSTAQSLNAATSNAKTSEDVNANYRSMLQDKVDPREVGLRLEMLRLENKIPEEDYNLYVDKTNELFGSQLTKLDRETAHAKMEQRIAGLGENATDSDNAFLEYLRSPEKQEEARLRLEERRNAG